MLNNRAKRCFRAKEMVVSIGDVCDKIFLIEKGMLRNFYYDRKGNDITHWFASEHMIMTIPPSFFKREPSNFGIEAIEDTIVQAMSFHQMEEELKKSIKLERFYRLLATDIMIMLGRKVIDLQTQTAEYRYDQLLQTHPDIFQRAKLGDIAGYLGIKQQSLSRIRKLKRYGKHFLT
ncbi:MAG: cyclic nucleotide-binding domain-containing protein [Bacteroidota bacterium]